MHTSPRRATPGTIVIATLWLATMAPRIVQSLTAPKFKNNINQQVPYTAVAQLLDRGLGLVLIGTCAAVVVRRLQNLPERGSGLAVVLVSPWAYLVLRDMFDNRSPKIATLVYGFVVIAVWAAQPRLSELRLLGSLTIFTAVLSLAMAVALPAKGLYQSSGGGLVEAEKEILPWGILVGPVSSGNNLGQLLVMGLPAILLLRRRSLRLAGIALTAFAIVWSASRSSLGALCVMLVLTLVLRVPEPALRRLMSWVSLLALTAVVVALPVVTHSDQSFTNRGYIWRLSLEAWHTSPVYGLGSDWYSQIALLANNIAGAAFHGHNEVVQLAVTGGVVLLCLMAVVMAVIIRAAGQWVARGIEFPTVHLATMLVSCSLEVSYGLVDRDLFFPVTVLPMAFILLAQSDTVAASRPLSADRRAGRDAERAAQVRRAAHPPVTAATVQRLS